MRRTETHARSLDPVWDEVFEFDGRGVGSAMGVSTTHSLAQLLSNPTPTLIPLTLTLTLILTLTLTLALTLATQASMAAARAEGGELDNGEVGLEAFCARLPSCLVQRSDRHGED